MDSNTSSDLAPAEAIQSLILAVSDSSLDGRRQRPLQASLVAALAATARHQNKAASNHLRSFQNKARAQVAGTDAQLAQDLVGAAQQIILVLTELKPVPNLVWIEPGRFQMGSPEMEAERWSAETQHEVVISRGFWMGKYEVTQGEYQEVMGTNPSRFRNATSPLNGGTGGVVTNELLHPVETVSWHDATNYCGLLTQRERMVGRLPEGYLYRLPTESEWEYACRAGTATAFHYGQELRSGMANFRGDSEYVADMGTVIYPPGIFLGRTAEVGSYEANAWGLHDMHGNVWEWCQDWYGDYPAGPVTDPTGPAAGRDGVFRGGGFSNRGFRCRSAMRSDDGRSDFASGLGFRVVLGHPYPLD